MIVLITVILYMMAFYVGIGLVFALFFMLKGLTVVDRDAKGAGWGLRILLFPGSVAFWIVLLPKWLKNGKKHQHDPLTS